MAKVIGDTRRQMESAALLNPDVVGMSIEY